MESTNSGSIQSSSSGDNEEYDAVIDSPAPSSSSTFFLNLPPPPPPPPPPATTHPASSSIFDSFSPYFAPFPFPPQPPEHAATWPSPPPPPPPPPLLSASAPSSARGGPTPPPVQPVAAPRGPKKRTRASRRAPTTVINTETSNFRSMVQQFTGFPSPPFAAAAAAAAAPQFQSPGLQLDLFGSSAAAVPQFLLRPSAQKMIPSPASSSASPSLFDHFIARSNLASIGNSSIASANVDGAPKYHDRFPLSLFEQQPDADAANRGTERGSFMHPSFRQPQRAQMAQLRAEFAGGSLGSLIATGAAAAATNITTNNRPRTDAGLCWDVNEQSGEERRPASSIEDQQPYQKLWRPNLD